MEEPRRQDACFDLPRRKWWIPPIDGALDFSVEFHSLPAGTPFGPAAGPHAQMAQNILLAWLAGSRIIEWKTIQILDELTIPRPCIDIRNIGFNVEWSQELKLEQSAREYAAGAMLIAFARAENLLGIEPRAADARPDPVVFDLSVGYDLKGVRSKRVTSTIRSLMDGTALIESLRREIPAEYKRLRGVEVDPELARTATISTFHGCPPEEIEGIATYLMEEFGLHTVVKMNPTLLGRERVEALLRDTLGYDSIHVPESAFAHDMKWDESIELARRLETSAERLDVGLGFKFTNTLVVENDEGPFAKSEKTRYLSGAPLHVLSLTVADEWRRAANWQGGLSFSAGIDKHNAADAVACGFVPVTTCTDLLKLGGYGRLPEYLAAWADRMKQCDARNRNEFILRVEGKAAEAARLTAEEYIATSLRETLELPPPLADVAFPSDEEVWNSPRGLARLDALLDPATRERVRMAIFGATPLTRGWDDLLPEDLAFAEMFFEDVVNRAAMMNHQTIAERTRSDSRYAREKNAAAPKKIASHLSLFDCINCDKCIPACPNGAIFFYEVEPETRPLADLAAAPAANPVSACSISAASGSSANAAFVVKKNHQLAIVADWCNACGNCETYCPETGGPFVEKPNFYGSVETFLAEDRANAFAFEPAAHPGSPDRIHGRIDGEVYRLDHAAGGGEATLTHVARAAGDRPRAVRLSWPDGAFLDRAEAPAPDRLRVVEAFHRLRVLLDGVARSGRVNAVNAVRAFPVAPRHSAR